MKHHIIVKWNGNVVDKAEILEDVRKLYSNVSTIPGISGCEVIPNCVARDNRYDCMIIVHLEPDALPAWDESEIHHLWKKQYGDMIEKKAIFDCE